MRVALGVVLLVLALLQHSAVWAQGFLGDGRVVWPDVPQIVDEGPPPPPSVGLRPPPAESWPGTRQPNITAEQSGIGETAQPAEVEVEASGNTDATIRPRTTRRPIPPLPFRNQAAASPRSVIRQAADEATVAQSGKNAENTTAIAHPAVKANIIAPEEGTETESTIKQSNAAIERVPYARPAAGEPDQNAKETESAYDAAEKQAKALEITNVINTANLPEQLDDKQNRPGITSPSVQIDAKAKRKSVAPGNSPEQGKTKPAPPTASETVAAPDPLRQSNDGARQTHGSPEPKVASLQSKVETNAKAEPKDEALARMIGQMIIIGFDGGTLEDAGFERVLGQLENGAIGGVVFAGRNVENATQLKTLTDALRKAKTATPPLLAISHEGGPGQALTVQKGFSAYPSAGELGRSNDPLNAFNIYQHMAEELALLGFNVNLGPPILLAKTPADVDTAGKSRSYGASPKHVAAFVKAFKLAHAQQKIASVPTLFSATDGNNDDASVVFRHLIESGNTDAIMIDGMAETATLRKTVTQTLRDKLSFSGVILTKLPSGESESNASSLKSQVETAIAAGSDALLIGLDGLSQENPVEIATAAIHQAIDRGDVTRDQLKQSVDRITALKTSLFGKAEAIASAERTAPAQ